MTALTRPRHRGRATHLPSASASPRPPALPSVFLSGPAPATVPTLPTFYNTDTTTSAYYGTRALLGTRPCKPNKTKVDLFSAAGLQFFPLPSYGYLAFCNQTTRTIPHNKPHKPRVIQRHSNCNTTLDNPSKQICPSTQAPKPPRRTSASLFPSHGSPDDLASPIGPIYHLLSALSFHTISLPRTAFALSQRPTPGAIIHILARGGQ